ncbi:MAG: hypothetical protein N2745_01325 [Syntrophorhabdaceae bacterium]|nr:hypothetical protein [Syntrophorhabdaceae bacterium]
MKNEKGFILAVVLSMTLLVAILATAAIKMSELGYLAYGSERKYQIADTASEYGLNMGVQIVSSTGNCPSANTGTLSTGGVSASYSYFSISGGNYCFIHSKGQFAGASVVKTTIVPTFMTGNWGALVIDSGTVNLGGSGSVAFCDTACPNGGPAIMYIGATTITGGSSTVLPSACPNNPKGAVGNPPTQQNASLPADLTSTYFNSTDIVDLENDLRAKYSVDDTSIANMNSSCKYTGSSACSTTSSTNISCGTTNISLTTCPQVYIQSAALTIGHAVTGKTVYSGGRVTVTGATVDTNVFADTIYINASDNSPEGGVYFARNTTQTVTSSCSTSTNCIYVKSNKQLGTATKPILYISRGGTLFDSNGGPDIYGFIYTSSTATNVNGNIIFKGSFVNDNNATITFGGNASIQFDLDVLNQLKTNLATVLKTPTCGGRQMQSSLLSTKVTIY